MPATCCDLVGQIEIYCLRFEMNGSLRVLYGRRRSMSALRICARIGPATGLWRGRSRNVRPAVSVGRRLSLALQYEKAGCTCGDGPMGKVPDLGSLHLGSAARKQVPAGVQVYAATTCSTGVGRLSDMGYRPPGSIERTSDSMCGARA